MAEDHIVASVVGEIVQAVCLPVAVEIPGWNEDVANEVCFFTADEGYWRNRANIFNDVLIELLGVPEHIVGGIQRIGDPHAQHRTVSVQFEDLVETVCWLGFFFLRYVIDGADDGAVARNNHDWFSSAFVLVDGNGIIFTGSILQQQRWTTGETAGSEDGEFQSTFWNIDAPAFSWLQW